MKKILFFILPALLTGLLSCKNTNLYTPETPVVNGSASYNNRDTPPPGTPVLETPQAYNNYIVARHQKVQEAILTIINATNKQPEMTGNTVVDEALIQINRLTNEVKAMPPYRGSDTYRDAAIGLFEFYATTFAQGYRQIADYKTSNKIPQKEVFEMQNPLAAISANEKKMDAVFQVQQQIFADTNHFVLANTAVQPRVDCLY